MEKVLGLAGAAAAAYWYFGGDVEENWSPPRGRKPVILITGAASGIGLATAKLMMQKGWFVGCYDVDVPGLEREFGQYSDDCCCVGRLDVVDLTSCQDAVKDLLSKAPQGQMDVLFNCAGILRIAPFTELSVHENNLQIDINNKGVVNLTHVAFEPLKKSKGIVVTMASLSAMYGIPNHAVYAATKAFVFSLTEALRTEFAQDGIRVCDVSAPYVATQMTATQHFKGGTFDDKASFLSAEQVANKVYEAIHTCSFYNEHFFVGTGTESTFKFAQLCRVLKIRSYTDMVAKATAGTSKL